MRLMSSRLPHVLWTAVLILMMASACTETKYTDVSTQPGYQEMVGATYTIVKPIGAYGIRQHSKAPIESISIVPPPGIEGPEVGFRVEIPSGSTMTVLGVYESNRFFDGSISLEVKFEGVALPENVPIHVDLMRGNQGDKKLSLNPAVFRRN